MLRQNISANTIREEQQLLMVTQNTPKGNSFSCNNSNASKKTLPQSLPHSQPQHFQTPKIKQKRFNICYKVSCKSKYVIYQP